jgi:D-3-phosphoglycerate dehydrogenase
MRIDRDVPPDLRAEIADAVGANLLEVVDLS